MLLSCYVYCHFDINTEFVCFQPTVSMFQKSTICMLFGHCVLITTVLNLYAFAFLDCLHIFEKGLEFCAYFYN
jgi:hypothetical protein